MSANPTFEKAPIIAERVQSEWMTRSSITYGGG
jgi:hypothetical protein